MIQVGNALVSVYDKSGLEELCRSLSSHGANIYATGKTSEFIKSKGFEVKGISNLTGFTDLLDGRVKTLHPAVFSSLLALRDNREHMQQLSEMGIPRIDMVVSNLYPFDKVLHRGGATLDEMLELIDIGGVALTRAAAKNYRSVAAVTSVDQYPMVIRQLEENSGMLTEDFLKSLAVSAFARTAGYDAEIASFLGGSENEFGENLFIHAKKKMDLRYGENPFQKAAVYRAFNGGSTSVLDASVEGGKELSFNNLLDLNIALEMAVDFRNPCAIIVKHANPSAVAEGDSILDALSSAYESDALSAYGCVIGSNRKIDLECARFLGKKFVDAIIAPDYEPEALELLNRRKKMRVLKLEGMSREKLTDETDIRRIVGGYLAQTTAVPELDPSSVRTVTKRRATEGELQSLLFGWKVVRFLWSNAVVLSRGRCTTGIGAGQSSRVDAVKIAVEKSRGASRGSVMASDAFFPFRDGIDEAARGGVTAVLQPGGSIRDAEVIEAADEHGIAMLFTGQRLFRH